MYHNHNMHVTKTYDASDKLVPKLNGSVGADQDCNKLNEVDITSAHARLKLHQDRWEGRSKQNHGHLPKQFDHNAWHAMR